MSVEKNLGTLFFILNSKSIFIKGAYYYENHSKSNQIFTKEVLP